jgi:proteic killer suppression protein
MLRALDAPTHPEQLNLPGYHFHTLRGAHRWSIRVTGDWRMTFGWDGADAVDVDLEVTTDARGTIGEGTPADAPRRITA